MVFIEIGLNRRFSVKAPEKGGKITTKDRVRGEEEGLVGWWGFSSHWKVNIKKMLFLWKKWVAEKGTDPVHKSKIKQHMVIHNKQKSSH